MIAVNWFEVLLPSTELEIYVEHLKDPKSVVKREKSIEHRTVLISRDDQSTVYHITTVPLPTISSEKVNFNEYPSLGKYAIEHGFANQLQKAGFRARLKHLGGVGYHNIDISIKPRIYQSAEGIKFRCFYGFGRNAPKRWGLVLSYLSTQFFLVNLNDPHLRELATGKRVIPFNLQDDDEVEGSDTGGAYQHSYIFDSIEASTAILIDREGNKHAFPPDDWTLPCRRDNLLAYVRRVEGSSSASRLATRLLQDSLTLTSEGRINTSLAKDQLVKLQGLMTRFELLNFPLPLPGQPTAGLSQNPLQVGSQ